MSKVLFDSQSFLKTVTTRPGVYVMLNEQQEILYIGKAKNLKKRLASYFQKTNVSLKTQSLVSQIDNIEVTVTQTENEALLLECNLIKKHHPRYNVLFRDDKSYPFIYCSTQENYPSLTLKRGRKPPHGRSFGPYPSAYSARESINLLQKLFHIRQCSSTFFRNRSRPCLQYQIKRCSAPCVGLISPQAYANDLQHALLFLEGKNHKVVEDLVVRMEDAALKLNYEEAALYRDQIARLRAIIAQQVISGTKGEYDVVALVEQAGIACIDILYIRNGQIIGNKTFFPKLPGQMAAADILEEFLPQYYLNALTLHDIPQHIILEHALQDPQWISQVLTEQSGKKVTLLTDVRKEKVKWLAMAKENAKLTLQQRLADKHNIYQRLESLQELLNLECLPERLECFDISHHHGESTQGSCVVFDTNGPLKSDYRRFNITGVKEGDDYAAMHQVLSRRYKRLKEGEGKIPDLVIIDGGKGQLHQAEQVLEELQINGITLLSIAKGPGRKAGLESLFISGNNQPVHLPPTSPAFHLLQHIRDEAHRFAITGHRQRQLKSRKTSTLEQISGIGAKRRRDLLHHFGGIQQVRSATVEELSKVPGISKNIAQRIFDALHHE